MTASREGVSFWDSKIVLTLGSDGCITEYTKNLSVKKENEKAW